MRFTIEPRDGYVHAALWERETAEEMREFLLAVHAACREHACSKVIMLVRRSPARPHSWSGRNLRA